MDFIFESIAWLLNLCYKVMFENYAIALLLFALIIKLVLLPLGIFQHSNSIKQAKLRPMEAAIMKKYNGKNDRASQQKRQMEIQEMQQKGGYNQLLGCLPMLIQLPVVFLVYSVITSPLSYFCGFSKDTITSLNAIAVDGASKTLSQIELLGAMKAEVMNVEVMKADPAKLAKFLETAGVESADALIEMLPNFNLWGLNLAELPSWTNLLWIIPVLNFALGFLSTKLMKKFSYQSPMQQSGSADSKISLMIMELMMPLLSTVVAIRVPAAIGIYWIYQNLLSLLQQFIIVKAKPFPKFTEEDYKEAEREVLGKKKKNKRGAKAMRDPNKPYVPSLHHIDDDEYNAKLEADTKAAEAAKPKKEKSKGAKLLGQGKVKNYDEDEKPQKKDSNDTADEGGDKE